MPPFEVMPTTKVSLEVRIGDARRDALHSYARMYGFCETTFGQKHAARMYGELMELALDKALLYWLMFPDSPCETGTD